MGRLVSLVVATAALAFGLVACMQPASMGGVTYTAHLTGKDEVPPTTSAGVVIPFDVPKAPAGTITGSKALTDAQYADLNSGLYYANIHTDANKGGEIRGQIARQ